MHLKMMLRRRQSLLVGLIAVLILPFLGAGQPARAAQQPTSMDLSSDTVDAHKGDPITFTAWVSCDGIAPTGTVSFYDRGQLLDTVDASDGFAATTQSFDSGSHLITAVYSGDENCASSSKSISQIVGLGPGTITLTISPNPATVTQTVTLTATVQCGVIDLFGLSDQDTVTFSDGGSFSATVFVTYGPSAGVGTASVSGTFAAGTYNITASYSGDTGGDFCTAPKSPATGTLVVNGVGGVTVVNCPIGYPILGSVIITTAQSQPGFDMPNGDQASDSNHNKIVLPNDADHSGSDEYLIIAIQKVNGKTWYGLYVGGCVPVWVPASKVTLHRLVQQ